MSEQPAVTTEAPDDTDREPAPQLLRALADIDNLRKRYERRLADEANVERARVTTKWLSVVDDLERALANASAQHETLAEGVRAVYEQALTVLEQLGFQRFEDIGRRFDPVRHEAVSAIHAAEEEPGSVLAAVRAGYEGADEHVLRPARVVVARTPD
jgi:molecular chaperone GrpE